jgi:uncharacterized protein (DUF362 family)
MNVRHLSRVNRREFIKTSLAGVASLSVVPKKIFAGQGPAGKTMIALVKTQDRSQGVKDVIKLLSLTSPKGKKVMIKPNFNTADPAPGSTHNDTLRTLILELKAGGAANITVGERSGPPPTKGVMEAKGIFELAKDVGFEIINFEDLPEDGWVHLNPPGSHWKDGFDIAKPAAEAEYLVSTCCLKTHRWGTITMSLKLAVGITPKRLMRELHASPDIRKMIAELNLGYRPEFIIMDGVEAFVDGGPSNGKKVDAQVFIGGTNRVAVDAVGVAILKDLGSNEAIMSKKIFEQEQIQRAVELGLGSGRPDQIEFVTPDAASRAYAEKIRAILAQG